MTVAPLEQAASEGQARDKVIDAMIAAYRANGDRRYQGFYYMTYHVIRDLSRSHGDQRIWEAWGPGEHYQGAHDAMMARLERLRFEAVLDVFLELTMPHIGRAASDPRPLPAGPDAEGEA